jgi:hypothetical protein
MSATTLVKDLEAGALLDSLLPREQIKLGLALALPPRRNSGALVGTAYDYTVRCELLRRHPNARTEPWVAETVLARFEGFGEGWTVSTEDEHGAIISSVDGALVARWRSIIEASRAAVAAYTANATPTDEHRASIVQHALRLARIDTYFRAGYVDQEPERVDARDVQDVLALIDATPLETLGSSELLCLNPSFGKASARVGGADADLISGDLLVDLKTATNPSPRGDLRQLVAYLFLARAARREDNSFPEIRRLAIYYARHRRLWVTPATVFTEQPQFVDVEARFFERAEQLFGPVEATPKPRPKKAKARQRAAAAAAKPKRASLLTDGPKAKRPRKRKKSRPADRRNRTSARTSPARRRKR